MDVNDWNDKGNSRKWRQDLAATINAANDQIGVKEFWEHRSFQEQGIEREPTIHLGPIASALERQGIRTERGDINRAVRERNRALLSARQAYSRAVLAVWQLEQAAAERAAAAGNEITELIDRIMEQKGRLYLPLVGAPYFKKMPHREALLDAGNVKQFVMDEEIKDFPALETYAQGQERSFKETERKFLPRSKKLRRLKELSAAYAAYQPYIAVRKKHRDLKGLKAALYEKQHQEELETGERLWKEVKQLLDGVGDLPRRQWDVQIRKLSAECRELSEASGGYVCRLAFAEVIRYNRRMYLSERGRDAQRQRRAGQQRTVPEVAGNDADGGGRKAKRRRGRGMEL